ncbi:MAG: GNAT family N-acetyltransferase, partial [Planctomycetes bacterium]|nr:GNAT family N-acetyltransferase [Planctomycetota bacterium]
IDRVLGRFAQNGRSSDRRWYLVGQGTQLAGCLLLTDHADVDRCELGYMGLVPEFRGRGGGRWLAEYAVWQARQLGRSHVITAVDAENDPAVAAYAAAVFDPVVRRRVYFRHLIAPGDVSPCLH